MTPKEQYEINKARRKAEREAAEVLGNRGAIQDIDLMEIVDRFVTAVERIADAMEAGTQAKIEARLMDLYKQEPPKSPFETAHRVLGDQAKGITVPTLCECFVPPPIGQHCTRCGGIAR